MTQADVGRALTPKVTRASIANIEAGSQRLLAHTLAQLSSCLEVSFENLVPNWTPERNLTQPTVAEELTKRLTLSPIQLRNLTKKLKLPS